MITINLQNNRLRDLRPNVIGVSGDNEVETLRFLLPASIAGFPTLEWKMEIHVQRPDGDAFKDDLTISDGLYADFPVTSNITLPGQYRYSLR